MVLLEWNLYGHPLAGFLWETIREGFCCKIDGGKPPLGNVCFAHRQQGLSLSVCVDDIKKAGRKQNWESMWEMLMNKLEKPTTLREQVYQGHAQRERKGLRRGSVAVRPSVGRKGAEHSNESASEQRSGDHGATSEIGESPRQARRGAVGEQNLASELRTAAPSNVIGKRKRCWSRAGCSSDKMGRVVAK